MGDTPNKNPNPLEEQKILDEIHVDVGLIKNTLNDINVEMACLKNCIDKTPPTPAAFNFQTIDQFIKYNLEIQSDRDSFNSFYKLLEDSVSVSQASHGNDLTKYFKSVFVNFFRKEIFEKLSWAP